MAAKPAQTQASFAALEQWGRASASCKISWTQTCRSEPAQSAVTRAANLPSKASSLAPAHVATSAAGVAAAKIAA